ncbi:hypothetical protein HDV00_008128 [Rhizophlyctis rosea]|nr:hypothetical protein HDV00_008128 [Rhizophlyctis rosea]
MRFFALATLLGSAAALAVTPSSVAPPVNTVKVTKVTYGGTGCPQGTASVDVAKDGSYINVIFDQYYATVDATTAIDRKNCQLGVSLSIPSGYSYSITSVNYRGGVYLDKGVTATQTATYFFAGNPVQATKATQWKGPMDYTDYVASDSFALEAIVWSGCAATAPLNINSAIFASNTANRKGNGYISTDSLDATFQQQYNLQWKRC